MIILKTTNGLDLLLNRHKNRKPSNVIW